MGNSRTHRLPFLCVAAAMTLLMLGFAAYQRWAHSCADQLILELERGERIGWPTVYQDPSATLQSHLGTCLGAWEMTPFIGKRSSGYFPSQAYYLFFKKISGEPLANDPSLWERWFQIHRHAMAWDPVLRRIRPRSGTGPWTGPRTGRSSPSRSMGALTFEA